VGMPASLRSLFITSLSMQTADPRTPDPTKGPPRVSGVPGRSRPPRTCRGARETPRRRGEGRRSENAGRSARGGSRRPKAFGLPAFERAVLGPPRSGLPASILSARCRSYRFPPTSSARSRRWRDEPFRPPSRTLEQARENLFGDDAPAPALVDRDEEHVVFVSVDRPEDVAG